MQFAGRNGRYRVIRWWIARPSMWVRLWPTKLLGIHPLHAFVPCELERNPLSSSDDRPYVNEDAAVDCFSCEVNIFISLNEEVGHLN